MKLGCLLDPHLRPCTYPTKTTVIPISEGKISTISETGKPILLKYQSSSQFSVIPSRASVLSTEDFSQQAYISCMEVFQLALVQKE